MQMWHGHLKRERQLQSVLAQRVRPLTQAVLTSGRQDVHHNRAARAGTPLACAPSKCKSPGLDFNQVEALLFSDLRKAGRMPALPGRLVRPRNVAPPIVVVGAIPIAIITPVVIVAAIWITTVVTAIARTKGICDDLQFPPDLRPI